jgi:CheY-like chemotaxis protein
MYGTVRVQDGYVPLGAFTRKKSQAPARTKTGIRIGAKRYGLAVEGCAVSFSPTNKADAPVVLVVEDEFFVRSSIAASLRDAGYHVVECGSGEDAIALCKSYTSIDIVFTDINLSGSATGWDVAECFRLDRPTVSVLYASAKSIDPQRAVPGSVFVAKPYDSGDILAACRRVTAGA